VIGENGIFVVWAFGICGDLVSKCKLVITSVGLRAKKFTWQRVLTVGKM